jgi:hypothetical protein
MFLALGRFWSKRDFPYSGTEIFTTIEIRRLLFDNITVSLYTGHYQQIGRE